MYSDSPEKNPRDTLVGMKSAPVSKRGRVVVLSEDGVQPATWEDLEGASLISDRGPLFVETVQGLEPATPKDLRSAAGRITGGMVSRRRGGLSSAQAKAAAAKIDPSTRKVRASKAGAASAARKRAAKGDTK